MNSKTSGPDILSGLGNVDMIIAGQVLTSRLETLEKYYRSKVRYLEVIGVSNPFGVRGSARFTLYRNGKVIKEGSLFGIELKGIYWINQLLMGPVFILYAVAMIRTVLMMRRKFDVFIGIACFSTLFGILLKKLGIVRNVIYYTLDYYPMPESLHINTLINKAIWYLDRFCCRKSCMVWNISAGIPEAREKLMRFAQEKYRSFIVPLTYDEEFLRYRRPEEIDQNTLVFVGTLSRHQGLQLAVESMAGIISKKREMKVRVIGKGPFERDIRRTIAEKGLEGRFIFHGFVEDEQEVFDIVSRCAVGICPWTDELDNNVIYADPGKPKLYAFCGIPVVITRVTAVADEIHNCGAGIAIKYSADEFAEAVLKILESPGSFERFRKSANQFALKYTTNAVFDRLGNKVLMCARSAVAGG